MESWIDERVLVTIYADREPLVGQLLEVGARGIVVQPDIPYPADRSYPDTELVDVLVFVPMNRIITMLRYK